MKSSQNPGRHVHCMMFWFVMNYLGCRCYFLEMEVFSKKISASPVLLPQFISVASGVGRKFARGGAKVSSQSCDVKIIRFIKRIKS